jgi:hypothetical protein
VRRNNKTGRIELHKHSTLGDGVGKEIPKDREQDVRTEVCEYGDRREFIGRRIKKDENRR